LNSALLHAPEQRGPTCLIGGVAGVAHKDRPAAAIGTKWLAGQTARTEPSGDPLVQAPRLDLAGQPRHTAGIGDLDVQAPAG
jgi:hypothetical protein